MRHKKIPFTELNDDRIGYYDYNEGGDTNKREIEEMKKFLNIAMFNELTDKQLYCVEQYYSGRKMKDIAKELGVSPSTVTRHIQRGLGRIKRVTRYYN